MTDLTSPMTLTRGPQWRNRMALAPMTNRQSNPDGTLSDNELQWLSRRAQGGFGLVMSCAAHVTRNGQGWPGELGVWSDDHLEGLALLARTLRAQGAVSSIQLHHGGLRADSAIVNDLVAPWSDPDTGARALTTPEIESLITAFVEAATRVDRAGFDGVEVHGAHGYLIAQFLDSDHNHRDDGYGATTHGRSQFLREIISGIRDQTSSHFQVGLRLSPERWGIHLTDAKMLAEQMMLSGLIDYLDMSLWDVRKTSAHQQSDIRPLLAHFADLERGDTRLGVAGKISSAATAQACLNSGIDFVSIGTGAILHHDFAAQAAADATFAAVEPPVTVDYLLDQSVSEPFIAYLSEIRQSLVAR